MAVLYATEAIAFGKGRDGHIQIPDLGMDFPLATPKDMGGSGAGTNPEQLFAAGLAACFHAAMAVVCNEEGIDPGDSFVGAGCTLNNEGDNYWFSAEVEVVIPGLDYENAHYLMEATKKKCPFVKAIEGNMELNITLVDG